MRVVDWKNSEHGPQRRRDAGGRLLHCCCICGRLAPWGDGWSYYGSYKDLEDGTPVPKFCSEVCKAKGGPDAAHVTAEMKETARASEWREPTLQYCTATEAERYNSALQRQRPSHQREEEG
jgi:hypothetical protein